jgi:hypothetical protein
LAFIEARPGSKIFRLVTFRNHPTRTTAPTNIDIPATNWEKVLNLGIAATLPTELSMEPAYTGKGPSGRRGGKNLGRATHSGYAHHLCPSKEQWKTVSKAIPRSSIVNKPRLAQG